jgi:hypothetical protein
VAQAVLEEMGTPKLYRGTSLLYGGGRFPMREVPLCALITVLRESHNRTPQQKVCGGAGVFGGDGCPQLVQGCLAHKKHPTP